jgi:Fe2+ transport system protein FeoA
MKLKEAKIGNIYYVSDINFCNDCELINDSCMILSLMEKGLVPGAEFEIIKKDLGLYHIRINNSSFIIRKSEAEKFNIEIE